MSTRSSDRKRSSQIRATRALRVLVALFVVVVVATVVSAVATPPSAVSAPPAVTSPRPSPPAFTPSATPTSTPTPTTTPTPPPAEQWVFEGAWLDVPCVGISGPISEYTSAMLVDGAVEPAAMDTIAWYSGISGGILSAQATNTKYLYGHSWTDPAIFNGVKDMVPGCEAIITTANGEVLRHVMTEPTFTVMKPDLPSDPRVTEAKEGRLLLISCFRPAGYDPNSATVENVIAVLQYVAPEPEVVPIDPARARWLADHLE